VLDIYVDADACPVKQEVYRVAQRYRLKVILVANAWMRAPLGQWLELVVVESGPDAADDWIAERVGQGDIVICGDIPLAARCLERGARVIGPRGKAFTEDSIGTALADRELLAELRDAGLIDGGPPPFGPRDRSQFLQSLDQAVQEIRRAE
jgi:uncharacterized protein